MSKRNTGAIRLICAYGTVRYNDIGVFVEIKSSIEKSLAHVAFSISGSSNNCNFEKHVERTSAWTFGFFESLLAHPAIVLHAHLFPSCLSLSIASTSGFLISVSVCPCEKKALDSDISRNTVVRFFAG